MLGIPQDVLIGGGLGLLFDIVVALVCLYLCGYRWQSPVTFERRNKQKVEEPSNSQVFGYAVQQTITGQSAMSSAQALAAQLAHTTVTSQWNGGNYGQTYTTGRGVADRIQEVMRAWGCKHWLSCTRSINKFATEVQHDDFQYDLYDVDQYGVDAATKLAECLAWLQSVCTGSGEFWGWHEAYGAWDESEQLHADYLE